MFSSLATSLRTPSVGHQPPQAAWRWRYRDPATGEFVNHSELLTTAQIQAIDPSAELIPGSRVVAPWVGHAARALR